MIFNGKKRYFWLIFALLMGSVGLKCLSMIPGLGAQPRVHWNNKVYIAFGFHGNLYHSFRGDTNDESGFGKDIRIIRHIIKTMDRFNARGVPVRASWEFDNHFSLENLLPVHAPDIIRDIRRRVHQGRDEVLVMSYNNGLASAMTRRELEHAVKWAVSNPWGSGVKDIFGTYSPIVRPQEMMTTPGNFGLYREQGIQAVSLYYSATPFDTFRVFSRELSREEAHNPLIYRNDTTGEEILVVPTYNIGDLVENVNLGHWAENLHRMQRQGLINRDVLIFINFDADSEFWTGADRLTWPLNQLPNTKGLEGLIDEVKDRSYVRFTTLKDYLADHGPAGTVRFQQDTADGSFDGYNSWAEKRGATAYWTRISAARRIHQTASKAITLLADASLGTRIRPLLDEAFMVRLKALSTTNFGMATPFVAPGRERVMEDILDHLDLLGAQIEREVQRAVERKTDRIHPPELPEGQQLVDTLMIVSPDESSGSSRFVSLPVPGAAPGYRLMDRQGGSYRLVPVPGLDGDHGIRFHVSGANGVPDGIYYLCKGPRTGSIQMAIASTSGQGAVLENDRVSIGITSHGQLSHLTWNGEAMVAPDRFLSSIRYRGKRYTPASLALEKAETDPSGTGSLELSGEWSGPGDRSLSEGAVHYRFQLVPGLPYLFVDGRVRYPGTCNTDMLKSDLPSLSRHADLGWQEVAPFELSLVSKADPDIPVRVFKNNYMDVDTAYDLDYHRHSPENLTLDNVNNHITSGYAGMGAGGKGVVLSFDPTVAANFAAAPIKVRRFGKELTAQINPFGTYHGKQNLRPTWGTGHGHEAALISGEQYHSAAPTYNGKTTRFSLMVGFFNGSQVPDQVRRDMKSHANPGVVYGLSRQSREPDAPAQPSVPEEYAVSIDRGRVTFSWKGDGAAEYAVRIGTRSGRYPYVFRTRETSLSLDGLSPVRPFTAGQQYFAVIEATGPGGAARTREILLNILDSSHMTAQVKIPWQFPLKVLWANFAAFIR